MTIRQAAKKWGMAIPSVGYYCRAGRVPGAVQKEQTAWSIPDDAVKPEPGKRGRKKVVA